MKKIWKKFLSIIMVSSIGVSLVACGGSKESSTTAKEENAADSSSSDASGSDGQVVLRMAWWGSQARHDATVAVANLYMEKNPEVKIEVEYFDFDGYVNKLNTLVASNDVWDIFQLGGNFPTYLDKIVPVDDYIADGTIDVSNTTDAYLETTQYDNKQLSVSSGVNAYGIAYDPELFEEAGVAEPAENWTWDDWKDACLTINSKLGIFGSSKIEDFIAGCTARIPQVANGMNFFNTDNTDLGFSDSSLLVPYLEIKQELVEAGAYPDPGAIAEITDIENDFLVTGEAAMTWVASNQFPTIAAACEEQGRTIKLATLPRIKSDGLAGLTVQSSQMMCISTDSDYPKEAAEFINFFLNDEEANKILAGERGVSVMSNVRDMLKQDATNATIEMYDYIDLVGSLDNGDMNVINPTQQAEIKDQYDLLMDKLVYGEITPDDMATEFYNFAKDKMTQ